MNKSYFIFIISMAIFMLAMSNTAKAVDVNLNVTGDAEIALGLDSGTNFGSANFIHLGNIGSSFLLKFDLSSISNFIYRKNSTAMLWFYKYESAYHPNYNITLFGTKNQTWNESTVTWNEATSNIITSSNNLTFLASNATVSDLYFGFIGFDVSDWVKWMKSQGYSNITFYVNYTTIIDNGTYRIVSKERTGGYEYAWSKLNITYEYYPILNSPINTTYYNNRTVNIIFSNNNGITIDKVFYAYNLSQNISVANGSSIPAFDTNNIIFFFNDTTGKVYNINVSFSTRIVCNATYNSVSICTGADSMFLSPCAYENGQWKFSNSNITRCDGSCQNGQCISNPSVCFNQCNVSSDQKACSGNNNDYAINCTYDNHGCTVWNPFNSTFCQYGCYSGICLNCTNECRIGETKGIGEHTYPCIQSGNCTIWDTTNGTWCEYGFFQAYNNITGLRSDFCNYHSFGDTYYLANSLWVVGKQVGAMFPDVRGRGIFTLIFAIIFAVVALVLTRSWMIPLLTALAILWMGALAGWFDWFQLIIVTLIIIFIIHQSQKDSEKT